VGRATLLGMWSAHCVHRAGACAQAARVVRGRSAQARRAAAPGNRVGPPQARRAHQRLAQALGRHLRLRDALRAVPARAQTLRPARALLPGHRLVCWAAVRGARAAGAAHHRAAPPVCHRQPPHPRPAAPEIQQALRGDRVCGASAAQPARERAGRAKPPDRGPCAGAAAPWSSGVTHQASARSQRGLPVGTPGSGRELCRTA